MTGCGTQEATIIDVVTSHNNEQRQAIRDKYKTMYGKVSYDVFFISFRTLSKLANTMVN